MKRSWPLALLLLSAGCAIDTPIQHIVVDQNAVLANSTDEVMLANILRAKNNQPMHFSLVSQFHGAATLTAGLALGATFPTASTIGSVTQLVQPAVAANTTTTTTSQTTPGASTYSPSVSGSFAEMPSFDSTIIDSQSFFQGFLKPIDPDILGHFLYDGWSPRLLTYLLVKRIELVSANDYDKCGNIIAPDQAKSRCAGGAKPFIAKGELIAYLDNDIFQEEAPGGAGNGINPFVDLVEHFQITGVTSDSEDDTPLFAVQPVSSLAGIEKIDGNNFDVKDHLLYRKGDSHPALILSRYNDSAPAKRSESGAVTLPFFAVVDSVSGGSGPAIGYGGRPGCRTVIGGSRPATCADYIAANRIYTQADLDRSGKEADPANLVHVVKTAGGDHAAVNVQVVMKARLRSPESVFYFVGEYLRKIEEDRAEPQGKGPDIFRVSQDWPYGACPGNGRENPFIVVTPTRPAHALLSAELNGTRYYIPDSTDACNGQSMKVLTLLEQLFYLQVNSSDKLGLTPTIHVVP